MSSRPSVASVVAMSSALLSPSGVARLTLRSPATSSSAPLGRLQSALTTLSIVELLFGGEVTSHDVPSPRPRCYLESDHIWPKLPHHLHREVWRREVEDCNAAAVSARRGCRDDAIDVRPAGVDSIGKFFSWKMPRPIIFVWPLHLEIIDQKLLSTLMT